MLPLLSLFFLIVPIFSQYDYQTPFSNIYANKIWNKNGPLSGPGSDACAGLKYLLYLQHLISRPEIQRIVQIGFGDWQMMQHILLQEKSYIGFEVVQQIKRESAPNREYRIVKGLRQVNQSGDLIIVRDAMQHWPTPEIDFFIDNILPNFRYALLTNDYTPATVNYDINPGGYRPINLAGIPNQKQVLEIHYGGGNERKVTILVTNPKHFP